MRRRIKFFQLWLHRHYHQIRQWIVAIVGVMLLIFAMIMIVNQNQLIQRVETLSQENKVLNKITKTAVQRTEQLSEENQVLAKQGRAYDRCIAEIFAKHTRDNIAVTIVSLDTCQVGNQDDQKTNAPTPVAPSSSNQSPSQAAQPAPQATTPPPSSTPSESNPGSSAPSPVVEAQLRLLGLRVEVSL